MAVKTDFVPDRKWSDRMGILHAVGNLSHSTMLFHFTSEEKEEEEEEKKKKKEKQEEFQLPLSGSKVLSFLGLAELLFEFNWIASVCV